MDDATLQIAIRMVGEEQANKLIGELKQSGVSGQDFNFALMTRLRTMQSGIPSIPTSTETTSAQPMPTGAQVPPKQ